MTKSIALSLSLAAMVAFVSRANADDQVHRVTHGLASSQSIVSPQAIPSVQSVPSAQSCLTCGGFNLPSFHLPQISLPQISLPKLHLGSRMKHGMTNFLGGCQTLGHNIQGSLGKLFAPRCHTYNYTWVLKKTRVPCDCGTPTIHATPQSITTPQSIGSPQVIGSPQAAPMPTAPTAPAAPQTMGMLGGTPMIGDAVAPASPRSSLRFLNPVGY